MTFKQMLKNELKGKGWAKIAIEAISLVSIIAMGYVSILMIGAIYG